MKKRLPMRTSLLFLSCLVVVASGCFELKRNDDLVDGVITGIVLDNDGVVATTAVASLADIGNIAVVDASGRFRFEGVSLGEHVVRLQVDADADGAPELGALRAVRVDSFDATPDDGSDADRVGGIDIGTVALTPTGEVRGRVVDVDGRGVGGATVALWRNVALDNNAGGLALDLAADLLATSVADGNFTITGVIVGDAELAAFDVVGATTTRASVAAPVAVRAAEPTEVGDQVLVDVDGTRPARITFTRPVAGVVEIRLARAGGVRPAAATILAQDVDGTSVVRFAVPFGIWDVSINAGTASAQLLSQVAPSLGGRDEVSWGVVELTEGGAPSPVCGDGVVNSDVNDVAEACDEGADNADADGAPCRLDCTLPSCGDGFIDGDEECDDGDDNSDDVGAACRVGCVSAGCGDGVVDGAEACDLGVENAATCTPVGDVGCDFCSATCSQEHVLSVATVVVDVRSAQGWGITRLAGVPVRVGDELRVSDENGVATIAVSLPSNDVVIVGGADAILVDRALVERRIPLPPNLGHGDSAALVATVHEGCVVDSTAVLTPDNGGGKGGKGGPVEVVVTDPANATFDIAAPSLPHCKPLRQALSWTTGERLLNVDDQPTVDYRVRVAAAPTTLTDRRALVGFPETLDDDGGLVQCNVLFDFRFEDGVHVDGNGAGVPLQLNHEAGAFERAWRLDDDTQRFVQRLDARDGDVFLLPQDGLWCIGEAAAATSCLVVTVLDTDGTPVKDAAIEYVSDVGGALRTIRRTTSDARGVGGCLQVSTSKALVSVLAPDGRRVDADPIVFANVDNAACGGASCANVTVRLPFEPFGSCLVMRPLVHQLDGVDVVDLPPDGPLFLTEFIDNEPVHRGRLPWSRADDERCVAVPNDHFDLEVFFLTMVEASCAAGTSGNRFDDIPFVDQTPSAQPPECGNPDCSVVDLDFFCGIDEGGGGVS